MRTKWSEKKIASLIAEGCGVGSGADYRPWIEVRDISSTGRKHLVPATRFGRAVHLLSDIEYAMFLVLDWSPQVLDVNEQFPLDRALTQDVARQIGIPHPYYPGTSVPTVMTVDFMVTLTREGQTRMEAFNTKDDSAVEDEREMQKLEIARSALELMEIPHHLVPKSSLPEPLCTNLDWLQKAQVKPGEIEPHPGHFEEMAQRFLRHASHASRDRTLAKVSSDFDQMHGVEPGTGLRSARILLSRGDANMDLNTKHPAECLMSGFATTAAALKLVSGA